MPTVTNKSYRFSGFTLDIRRGCLREGSREIELRPKSFEVLRYLVENAGRLIPKDELIQAVWPSVVVTDESLTRCVSDVRLALGDSEQRIIKTVPRRGYLFAADVRPPDTDVGSMISRDVEANASAARLPPGLPRAVEGERVQRRLAAILAADVAGYSRLIGADEEGTIARLRALRRDVIDPSIATHFGRIVKTTGDGILIEFPSVVEAVRCAVELQRGVTTRNADLPADRRIEYRLGIHLGDVVVEGDDLLGDGVNVAARLEGIAEPGAVCMSGDAYRQVKGKVDLAVRDLGEQHLRNIAEPVHVYAVAAPTASGATPGLDAQPPRPSQALVAPSEVVSSRGEPSHAHLEPRPAERRQLTVMACAWAGLAALSARLDPEDLEEVLTSRRRECATIIEQNHGHVARHLDDGLVAYFGYPAASEHAAEDAVRAGLILAGTAKGRDGDCDASLPLRIGMASGIVVMGERLAVGETPTLAQRMREVAEAGSVIIAESTRRLVGRLFEYHDLPGVAVDGVAEPMRAFHVLGPSGVEGRLAAWHEGALTPLVGRQEELELLKRRWRQACEGEGRVVLLSGEPGIGKSRLIVALEEELTAEAYARLRYFCSSHHADSALFPVINQLERAAGFERSDPPGRKLEKLAAIVQPSSALDQVDVALLANLLSLPAEGRGRLPEMSPQQRKEKTLAALLAQLEGLARHRPVLLVYEDVHWADPTTRELLELVVERVARLPVLLVLAFRPEFEAPWTGQAQVTSLTLSKLGRRDGMALVGHVAGNTALTEAVTAEIVERADGIPLFLEELTKAISEASDAASMQHVPATLHASLLARLDRLGAHVKEIAQIGAVIGREFTYELLAFVARSDDAQLQAAVAALGDAGLVFCRGMPPHATFLFKHALLQDVAYAMLLRDRRRELHARVAAALEAHFGEIVAAQPELLSRHCTAAGLTEKALGYWLKAAEQAIAHCALQEGVSQLHKGLQLLPHLPEGKLRDQTELDFQLRLGWASQSTQGYGAPIVGETFIRARQLCQRVNQPSSLLAVLSGLAGGHFYRGELREAREIAAEVLELRDPIGGAQKVIGTVMGASNALFGGEFTAHLGYYERFLALYDQRHFRFRIAGTAELSCTMLVSAALSLFVLGYPDQAARRDEEVVRRARQLDHSPTLNNVLGRRSVACRISRSASDMLADVEESLAISAKADLYTVRIAMIMRALCLAVLGREHDRLTCIAERVTEIAPANRPFEIFIRIWLGDTCRMLNEATEGLKQVDEAIRVIEATGLRFAEAEAHGMRGELLASAGNLSAAEQSLRRAIAVAQRQSAKLYELRASVGLARLWRDQGRQHEARDLLGPVYGWFTEGFDTLDLKEAKTLLDELNEIDTRATRRQHGGQQMAENLGSSPTLMGWTAPPTASMCQNVVVRDHEQGSRP